MNCECNHYNNVIDNSIQNIFKCQVNDNCIFNSTKQFYVKNRNHFKISHINVNSIRHKFEPLREVLFENIFEIGCIQKAKADDTFPEDQFTVPPSKVYRNDYKTTRRNE